MNNHDMKNEAKAYVHIDHSSEMRFSEILIKHIYVHLILNTYT